MRQRVVVLAQADGHKGQELARRKERFAKDKSLRKLLQSGAITYAQLDHAIDGYAAAPSDFSWMASVEEELLNKADRLFVAKNGRPPLDNADFRINGDYHKICRALQHDPHHFDDQLNESSVPSHVEVHVPVREPVRTNAKAPRKKNSWAFGVVIMLGFLTAPLLGVLIATSFPEQTLTAGLLLGSSWLLVLLVSLVLTFPRRFT